MARGVYQYTEYNEMGGFVLNPSQLTDKELKQAVKTMAGALNKNLRELERQGLAGYSPFYNAVRGRYEERDQYSLEMGESIHGEMIFKQNVSGKSRSELTENYRELRRLLGLRTRKSSEVKKIYGDTDEERRRHFSRYESRMWKKYSEVYGSGNADEYYDESMGWENSVEETDSILDGKNPYGYETGDSIQQYSRSHHPGELHWYARLEAWRPPTIEDEEDLSDFYEEPFI